MAVQPANIFVTKNGMITLPSFFLLIGVPLFMTGELLYGGGTLFLAVILALRAAMHQIDEEDKLEIRYNIISAEDIVAEIDELLPEKGEKINPNDHPERRMKCETCLAALARKCSKKVKPEGLPLLCQQASYMTLELYPNDDDIVSASIALLALVAKDPKVRERHLYEADLYGLNVPIRAMRSALDRAQQADALADEEQMAELQRKGCLFLGALADGDKDLDMANKIVEEEGLEAILDSATWYRHHEGVINWALWATFILCFDNVRNKMELVRSSGLSTVCQSMKSVPDSLEVARHGTAILFDILRATQITEDSQFDPWEVRRLAMAAGLHDVIYNAMIEHSEAVDIMMMGQEILIGTDFPGQIPEPARKPSVNSVEQMDTVEEEYDADEDDEDGDQSS